ncbi:MAG TPA: UDP-N-acetylglucosamine 2-epimerase (non-hydrolyzing) [Solirubrobacteraceae bacterium]|jgi:UDP-N-acetylglucosamine 2-epimerase (non-hydrolysing)/UDP-GlcNAc3NAcA epimerase|nr:UDP-N-acetylglucosamine 2-epimerase (non-hydrolyzing) [Solirubrobacteraceae bacterium]
MRVVTVIGNRPQFVKASAVSHRLRAVGEELLVHTGQHYDDELSNLFVRELDVPPPERELGLGGGSNTEQTTAMLAELGSLLDRERPDAVLVYGDTNSTLAGGLAAAQAGLPVVHVEAGMRSFDRAMPEEVNRVLTDHLASLLLCSSDDAARQLEREGVGGDVMIVGDVMIDVALAIQPRARQRVDVLERLGVASGEFLLVTAHRAGNVDDPERLSALVELLVELPHPVVLPLHPRTRERLERYRLFDRLAGADRVELLAPVGYLEFTALLCHARAVLTDSGGIQKEAYLAGVPCLTLRDRTEWGETVQAGWNTLVDLDREATLAALAASPPPERPPLYGDGHAGARVVEALRRLVGG